MLEELKQAVFQANADLVAHNLITLTWGNASGIDRGGGLVVIKPSGVSYEAMSPADMVVVDLDGKVVEGRYRPSSDTPSHLQIYIAWPKVAGVVHTHSCCATAFAQACRAVPCLGTTHADQFYGEVPVTRPLTAEEVQAQYELNTGKVIVECFRLGRLDPMAIPGVVVANHGPFTWGGDADEAVKNAVALEAVAKMALATMQINPQVTPLARYILDKHYFRKHGPDAYYGQDHSD
ncbi:MAG: L-ribulose-5-phosphate 4-epimerase [Planctomycetes bacterium]|nr:L-ribulose-5-phosphate 4-epimerase [Planctomycetota bacterium]